jgi:hypothetical protein
MDSNFPSPRHAARAASKPLLIVFSLLLLALAPRVVFGQG